MTGVDRWAKAQSAEYEHHSHSEPSWDADAYLNRWFDKDISFYHGKDILEVGSGTGMIHTLDTPGRKVGIDPLTSSFKGVLGDSNAEIVTGAGESLPFSSGAFDIVASHNVLDHCMDPAKVLEEMNRITVPGGHLVFHVNTFELPKFIRLRLTIVDRPHPHHFDDSEVIDLIENSGYEIVQQNKKMADLSSNSLKGYVASAFLPLGRIYVLARKHAE